LAAATKNAVIEGADATAGAITATTRVSNSCQIIRKNWAVTDTMEAVDKAGRASEFSYQMAKAMKELARDIEYAIVNGTGNTGATGAARELKGVVSFIATTDKTGTGTGTGREALTETLFNNTLQAIYDQGGTADKAYCNGFQKRKISAFSTPSTRFVDVADKELVASVDVYDSDFGRIQIILDRYMPTDTIAILQEELWRVATLRPTKFKQLPDLGGGPKGQLETELTLEALNEAASGKITNLTTA
jgi:hypothetical protein